MGFDRVRVATVPVHLTAEIPEVLFVPIDTPRPLRAGVETPVLGHNEKRGFLRARLFQSRSC